MALTNAQTKLAEKHGLKMALAAVARCDGDEVTAERLFVEAQGESNMVYELLGSAKHDLWIEASMHTQRDRMRVFGVEQNQSGMFERTGPIDLGFVVRCAKYWEV